MNDFFWEEVGSGRAGVERRGWSRRARVLPGGVWILALVCGMALVDWARGSDWPQFLGPTRDGVYAGPALSGAWPKDGPPTVWSFPVGEGFCGAVVSRGKVVIFHRKGENEVIDCLEVETGKSVWSAHYSTGYRDDFGFEAGPRATPAIVDGFLYTMGAEGTVNCVELASGKKVWKLACKDVFSAPKGYFGMACSPLIEGDLLLLNIGGADGAGIIALDKGNGKVRWKATHDEASYSSPVAATFDGQRRVIFFTRAGLVGVEPTGGKVAFEYGWRSRNNASVNAATPLVIGNLVFLSASYNTGAILLKITKDKPEKVWSGDDLLSNHYATSIYHDGYLYGFDGRQEMGPAFTCLELKTGKPRVGAWPSV